MIFQYNAWFIKTMKNNKNKTRQKQKQQQKIIADVDFVGRRCGGGVARALPA